MPCCILERSNAVPCANSSASFLNGFGGTICIGRSSLTVRISSKNLRTLMVSWDLMPCSIPNDEQGTKQFLTGGLTPREELKSNHSALNSNWQPIPCSHPARATSSLPRLLDNPRCAPLTPLEKSLARFRLRNLLYPNQTQVLLQTPPQIFLPTVGIALPHYVPESYLPYFRTYICIPPPFLLFRLLVDRFLATSEKCGLIKAILASGTAFYTDSIAIFLAFDLYFTVVGLILASLCIYRSSLRVFTTAIEPGMIVHT